MNKLMTTALAIVFSSSTSWSQVQYVEVPGDREFTGEMIARPVQAPAWQEQGLDFTRIEERMREARDLLGFYEIASYVPQTDEYVIKVPAGSTENQVSEQLTATGLFQYVEPNFRVFPIGCPNDPDLPSQWHHNQNRMQSCDGWNLHTGSPTSAVGYCDTGILTTHEDLQLHRREAYNAVDQVWENNGGNIGPVHEHGTWVTGCGSGNGDNGIGIAGVGWNLGHRMLRVSNDSSGSSSLSVLQHAARTSVENGDKVASLSYSGVDNDSNLSTATYIKSIGGLMVWAAGNDGRFLNKNNRDADDLIVAGGTDENDNLASFSAYGPFVDVTAPAVNVYTSGSSADNDYDAVSGTSFATPLTAGVCALIWSAEPGLSPDQVERFLKLGCDDLGAPGVDDDFAYGRIDIYGSLSEVKTIEFDYPNGQPGVLDPTGGTTMRVEVSGNGLFPRPDTGVLYTDVGGGFIATPMTQVSPNIYDAVFPGFPGAACGAKVRFYVSADATDGKTYTDPDGAPADAFEAITDPTGGTSQTIVDLDFETAPGWSVENIDLDDGAWDRGVPLGGGDRGDPANDYDGSGQCWLTDRADGNTDVDGGPTRLLSPSFDLGAYSAATVSYARWFYNDDGDQDRLDVEVSDDGGTSWNLAESVSGFGGWSVASFDVGQFATVTSQVRMRFSATDNPNNSLTEAALDAFKIEVVQCLLILDVSPDRPALLGSLKFTAWQGSSGGPVAIFVTAVNDVPVTVFLVIGSFDAKGVFTLSTTVPNDPILPGLEITFTAFGFNVDGKLVATPAETIQIQ